MKTLIAITLLALSTTAHAWGLPPGAKLVATGESNPNTCWHPETACIHPDVYAAAAASGARTDKELDALVVAGLQGAITWVGPNKIPGINQAYVQGRHAARKARKIAMWRARKEQDQRRHEHSVARTIGEGMGRAMESLPTPAVHVINH